MTVVKYNINDKVIIEYGSNKYNDGIWTIVELYNDRIPEECLLTQGNRKIVEYLDELKKINV